MSAEASFRYFERPHHFSTYREAAKRCDLCGQSRPGYDGPFYGQRDIEFVCEECLVTGRLADDDLSVNEGDRPALERQLCERHPEWPSELVAERAEALTAEVEQRTPQAATWQSFFWPAHCGDYRRYIKEVGQKDLAHLAPDGDGIAFLAEHAPDIADLAQARDVWETTRPDAPTDNHVTYSAGVYLFQCLTCQEYVILWDCD